MTATHSISSLPPWLNIPPLHWAVSLGVGFALHYGLDKPWMLGLPWPKSIGTGFEVLAVIIVLWSVVCFQRAKTPLHPHHKPCRLIATGPFSFTRNPMYLSLLLLSIGIAYELQGVLLWIAPLLYFASMNFVLIPCEERILQGELGEDYRNYCRRVRRWI
ncbi:MAG: methyltransferase family protein [Calditrichota bacterium]